MQARTQDAIMAQTISQWQAKLVDEQLTFSRLLPSSWFALLGKAQSADACRSKQGSSVSRQYQSTTVGALETKNILCLFK